MIIVHMFMIVMFNMKKVAGNKKYMYQTNAKYSKILNNYFKPCSKCYFFFNFGTINAFMNVDNEGGIPVPLRVWFTGRVS